MRSKLFALCFCIIAIPGTFAFAESSLGVVLGDPTGLSGRTSLDGSHSIEGAIAYATGNHGGLHIHGTYLWDEANQFATRSGPINLYYGLGARLIRIDGGDNKGDISIGPRAPLGLLYKFKNPSIEIFGELSLALDILPSTDVDLDACIGARIRF